MSTFEMWWTCAATFFVVAFMVYVIVDVVFWIFDIGQSYG